jgi:Flp pilus assembly pilin Flp
MSDLFTGLWIRVSNALHREQGQALTEYALVIALLASFVGIAAWTGMGAAILGKITTELGKI